jgi:hypothetical protein
VSSPKEICWGTTIYYSKQNKIKLKAKNKDAPRKTHSVLKDDLIFLLMK